MNKFFISCLLAVLLFIVPVAAFVALEAGNLENERRRISAFPEMPSKLRTGHIKRYFQGIDAFFADQFPLRSSLLALSVAFHEAMNSDLDIDKCYQGKKNWLFLGNDWARCVDKLVGRIILSGDRLHQQAEAYEKIRDAAEKCGAAFFIFIGPDKSTIYPEYLPPLVVPAQRRFIAPLVDSLNESEVLVYDPAKRLIEAKSAGSLLYYKTDTHWNARGAHEAFAGFTEWAGLPPLPSLSFADGPEKRGDLVGIGGYKSFPLSVGDNFTLQWSAPQDIRWEGNGLIRNAHAASNKTAWIFGDSFAIALQPYVIAEFREARFYGQSVFEPALEELFPKPDVIIWVITERNFAH